MGWEDIENTGSQADKDNENRKQAIEDRAKLYYRVFKSDDGVKLLAEMTNQFLIHNYTDPAHPNVDYVAAYKNGEAGVIGYILKQLSIAESL